MANTLHRDCTDSCCPIKKYHIHHLLFWQSDWRTKMLSRNILLIWVSPEKNKHDLEMVIRQTLHSPAVCHPCVKNIKKDRKLKAGWGAWKKNKENAADSTLLFLLEIELHFYQTIPYASRHSDTQHCSLSNSLSKTHSSYFQTQLGSYGKHNFPHVLSCLSKQECFFDFIVF